MGAPRQMRADDQALWDAAVQAFRGAALVDIEQALGVKTASARAIRLGETPTYLHAHTRDALAAAAQRGIITVAVAHHRAAAGRPDPGKDPSKAVASPAPWYRAVLGERPSGETSPAEALAWVHSILAIRAACVEEIQRMIVSPLDEVVYQGYLAAHLSPDVKFPRDWKTRLGDLRDPYRSAVTALLASNPDPEIAAYALQLIRRRQEGSARRVGVEVPTDAVEAIQDRQATDAAARGRKGA